MSDYVINALTEASYSLQNFIAQPESIRKIHTAIDPSLSEYFSVSHYRISINGKIRHRAP